MYSVLKVCKICRKIITYIKVNNISITTAPFHINKCTDIKYTQYNYTIFTYVNVLLLRFIHVCGHVKHSPMGLMSCVLVVYLRWASGSRVLVFADAHSCTRVNVLHEYFPPRYIVCALTLLFSLQHSFTPRCEKGLYREDYLTITTMLLIHERITLPTSKPCMNSPYRYSKSHCHCPSLKMLMQATFSHLYIS